jgi:hypothetical protein
MAELHQQLNVAELLKQASALNNGKSCNYQSRVSGGTDFLIGCANFHGRIIFEDRTEWLARIPRRSGNCPQKLSEYMVASEFATLKFLESTKVPAPRAYHYGLASDPENHIGVDYILMERLSGSPWGYQDETRKIILEGVADIMIELSQHPFPSAGSLMLDGNGKVVVEEMASNRYIHLDTCGPFATQSEYLLNICTQYMALILNGQVCPRWPREAFTFYATFASQIPNLASPLPGQFFLKHVDDKGDHILLDSCGTVSGMIDWQFTRCVPALEASGPSYVSADNTQLWSANEGLTANDHLLANMLLEKGYPHLADVMTQGEVMRRFQNGISDADDVEQAREILKGLLIALHMDVPLDVEAWVLEVCRGDERWVEEMLN